MLRGMVIVFSVMAYAVLHANGQSYKIVPILTKATVEGSDNIKPRVWINRYGPAQNFTLDIQIETLIVLHNVKMNLGYFVRTRNTDSWIYNKTIDFCTFLGRSSIDRFAGMLFEEFRRNGNVPNGCPIMPNMYRSTNNTLTKMRLPAFLPETSFGFVVNCYSSLTNEMLFRSTWFGHLKRILL